MVATKGRRLPERIEITLVSARDMSQIHYRYHQDSEPTDVLTFDYGEILVCPAVAKEEAQARNIPLAEELLRYCVHGLLHLAGWSDKGEKERSAMWSEQERIVQRLLRPSDTSPR
ncbi:rRNA maturation RNase YbeY [Candidatus Methylacidithermus pantelleriae]|uniref:Endoribonuclease YbeY n=1 Tax=Candidatus Methylacidithermus pantelleriae TaxID=2744239 RepID=A0A8J2FSK2_9BACT|nr:rRNA maturation RNase YbeY [Candidatus Methylacidithermus pantelleriae]CAF0699036.1 Endoribonuclease YbeY [Candidatus Methylacidithermus pantelleriae]